jgi:membrane-associated phospholipid phosphatase
MKHSTRQRMVWVVAAIGAMRSAAPAYAQRDCPAAFSGRVALDTGARHVSSPRISRRWLAAGALLLAAAAADSRLRDLAARHRRPGLDRLADAVDPFGRAGVLVPALAASVALPRVLGARTLSDQAARVAVGYAVSDAVESILKPLIGRHRPSDGGGPWRFRSLQNDADWHSLPSAHVVHAFSIASAVASELPSQWAARPAYAMAGLVGLERVYVQAHWSSDVVSSAMMGVAVSTAADRWVRTHGIPHVVPPVDGSSRPASAACGGNELVFHYP